MNPSAAIEEPVEQRWTVYALCDPRTDEVRYVGWTRKPLKYRLEKHINWLHSNAKRYRVHAWIKSLEVAGVKPSIRALETGVGVTWAACEKKWIAHYKQSGVDLTNLSDGGEGTPGRKVSEAECLAIAERARKRWAAYSPEKRKQVGANIAASGGIRGFWQKMDKDQRKAHMQKMWASMSPERRTEFAKERAKSVPRERWQKIFNDRFGHLTPKELSERNSRIMYAYWAKRKAASL